MREFDHLTLARVLIARYRSDRDEDPFVMLLELLDRLLQAAEDRRPHGSMIEILMLQRSLSMRRVTSRRAPASLEHALTLAEPEGYVRLFVGLKANRCDC